MIEIRNVSHTYVSGTEALKGVTLTLPPAQISAILGESGSGKTTLLMAMSRFLRPTGGDILFEGRSIFDMAEKAFRKALGIVFQDLHLFPHMTILENLVLAPVQAYGQSPEEAEREAVQLLGRLGIAELARSYPGQISGGQAQRAAIARGLILRPMYLLLDEPTSALDANTTDDFADWLLHLSTETHFVVVTHDLDFARKVAQEGVYLQEGEIRHSGSIDSLLEDAFGK